MFSIHSSYSRSTDDPVAANVPLLELHQLLLKEKELLQAEADSRLQAHIQDLHRRIDDRQLQDADALDVCQMGLDVLSALPLVMESTYNAHHRLLEQRFRPGNDLLHLFTFQKLLEVMIFIAGSTLSMLVRFPPARD